MSGDDLTDTGRFRLEQWKRLLIGGGRRRRQRRFIDRLKERVGRWSWITMVPSGIAGVFGADVRDAWAWAFSTGWGWAGVAFLVVALAWDCMPTSVHLRWEIWRTLTWEQLKAKVGR